MQIYELFITLATHTSISISYQLKEANRRDKFALSKPLLHLPHPTIKARSLLRCMPQQDTHLTRKGKRELQLGYPSEIEQGKHATRDHQESQEQSPSISL